MNNASIENNAKSILDLAKRNAWKAKHENNLIRLISERLNICPFDLAIHYEVKWMDIPNHVECVTTKTNYQVVRNSAYLHPEDRYQEILRPVLTYGSFIPVLVSRYEDEAEYCIFLEPENDKKIIALKIYGTQGHGWLVKEAQYDGYVYAGGVNQHDSTIYSMVNFINSVSEANHKIESLSEIRYSNKVRRQLYKKFAKYSEYFSIPKIMSSRKGTLFLVRDNQDSIPQMIVNLGNYEGEVIFSSNRLLIEFEDGTQSPSFENIPRLMLWCESEAVRRLAVRKTQITVHEDDLDESDPFADD